MYYCTEPLYDCQNQDILIDHYNTTEDGLEQCAFDRRRRIAARIYLGAAIFNAFFVIITTLIFIYCATGRTTVVCNDDLSPKELRKLRKRQSIQKRSVSATTLGAFGHLVFSTCMFLTQVFNNAVGCQLVLWGVVYGFYTWIFAFTLRAYRLRYLFRFNQLKVKYLRMSTAERLTCINDADYQWYLKRTRKNKYLMVRPYCIYLLSLLVILVITLPAEVMAMQAYGMCYVRWGSTLLVTLYAFFIGILVPFMLWYLRNNSDSHGIRTEVWVDAIVGIPFFILYLVWFVLNLYDSEALSIYISKTYGPGNWVIFFTITAHFCSVVFPIIAYLPIENRVWLWCQCKYRKALCRLQRLAHCGSPPKQADTEEAMTAASIIPELSMESLERTLADPEMIHQLQDLAIRDFSSENVIFYEKYLKLEEKFKNEFVHHMDNANHSSTSKNWINSLAKKSPTIPFITHMPTPLHSSNKDQDSDSGASEKEDDSFVNDKNQDMYNKFMSIPIPYKLYPDVIRLYEVFIKEDAPIQVNISFRARHTLDQAFHVLYQKHPELRPKEGSITTYANTNSFYLNDDEEEDGDDEELDIAAEKPGVDRIQVSHHTHMDPPAELNFYMFEPTRVEVCWNIFNSVYPKLVEMYNVDLSLTD
ncbi:hypothetical protein V8B55DRAFT_1599753 [Mucor lusitanicus]|uniref:RGS domain-containing protein n=2 Tax=Mucor circinelloides f. lusitanicus TaxID=29924 RepID=A0A168I913_MUCCL|nr:hypothetical protein FB192DRAFT_1380790 [Mucor lusitanicus]OAC99691.1 hypothetical protein MUCCIDRAFT_165519 [Mucor lusitanicus CBS 277.49]